MAPKGIVNMGIKSTTQGYCGHCMCVASNSTEAHGKYCITEKQYSVDIYYFDSATTTK
jgi:hypothetical protein